ncbi:MAG: DUF983 domain-containing protein [Hyphomicrobiaceae bacterium]|nr:DUF983 domain-containing protein [Hyphomicrobiaceae bacterium]
MTAALRGARGLCPACGKGRMFRAYLKVADHCPSCGEALHHQRADDAPPYFTMFIVGHFIVGGILSMEQAFAPPTWVQLAVWMPMTIVLSLLLLPVVKGALVAWQWALRMHGFGVGPDPASPEPPPGAALPTQANGGRA